MTKEFKFFVYLLESYAQYKNTSSDKILALLDEKDLLDFVYDMYFMYHQEAIENAFMDIESLIESGKPAW